MATLKLRENAQKLALRGDVAEAVNLLESLVHSGELSAHVSLTEIAAYRLQWPEVLERTALLLTSPDCMVTQNVYEDMAGLLVRAGAVLGQWAEVTRIARDAKRQLSRARNDDLRFETIREVVASAERRDPWRPEEEARDAHTVFKDLVAKSSGKKYKSDADRVNQLYAYARVSGDHAAAIELFDETSRHPNTFDKALFLAVGLARNGRRDDAWATIRVSLAVWWPVDVVQVLPVALLLTRSLDAVMTPDRCRAVLTSPRGPMAT